ncbi:MAG: neutral/alkaline non-lysosomal ceramidase N-terminal domain-containing protein [Bacteroidales bacterium]|nr:neutral/alkaline non-lysosomal ceramidase N-terminal domain-containing protein [Bacteroidales bacterium]
MKKGLRTFLRISGAIAMVLCIVLLWALERVDYSPYFDSNYYKRTISQLDSISSQLSLAKGEVQVGFGKASITPGLGAEEDDPDTGVFKEMPMAGFGSRKGTFSEGIHDSLFVKAVAIRVQEQVLVLIGSDMLIVPPNISEAVSRIVGEKTGMNRDQLFFSATHTHSSVGAWSDGFVGKQFAGLSNPNIVEWLVRQFSKAIESAVEDLQPGQVGSGSFEASSLVSNRLIGEKGEKNSEFIYIVANQNSGRRAMLGSFDAHATTLGGWNMQISADYPGYWQRKMESEGVDMAVFFAGSVGSHSPRSKGEKFEKSKYIGEALADSVLKYMVRTELQESIELSYLTLGMNLPEFHIRVSDGVRLNPVLGEKLFPPIGDVYIQAARIGDLIWVSTPSDFSGEMAIGYKNAMHKEGYRALVSSFNGAYAGYIIPGRYYHLNEYESRLMSWFGPNMGPYTNEMIRRMMQQLVSLDHDE